MYQQHQVENRHHQRAIIGQALAVTLRVNQVDRLIAQIAVADLLHQLLAHVARPVVVQAVDHEENRSEENNEKVND